MVVSGGMRIQPRAIGNFIISGLDIILYAELLFLLQLEVRA